jgi:hypothetical protein
VIARKGWLEPRDVLNTWSLEDVKHHFKQKRHA